jgi:hypothetical protein
LTDGTPVGEDVMPMHATALFADRHTAHSAVEQLVQAGFPRDAISVVMTEDTHEREFGEAVSERSGLRSKRPNGVLGAIVAGLVSLTRSGGVILRAAGPLVPAMLLTGEGALLASLVSAGLEEHEAHFLHDGLRAGAIAVGVQAEPERTRLASQLLALSGGAALQAA